MTASFQPDQEAATLENATHAPSQWQHVHEALVAQKAQINQSIREYPLPITACDDQFNYLLEKRSTITQELGRFNRLRAEKLEGQVAQIVLDEFIADSHFITEDALAST